VKVFPSVKRRWISTILHNGMLPHAIATKKLCRHFQDMKVFHHSDIPRISNINLPRTPRIPRIPRAGIHVEIDFPKGLAAR